MPEPNVQAVPILLYHSISSSSSSVDAAYTISPRRFREHLGLLCDLGVQTLTLTDYVTLLRSHAPLPPRCLLITFDDGYGDTVDQALPSLLDAEFTASVYVTTGSVGRRQRGKKMIDWTGVRTLHACGFEIGAHSQTHVQLDAVSHRRARAEVEGSKSLLEEQLSAPVRSFAYPHGYHTPWLKLVAATSGFSSACAVKNALSHEHDDVYALARLMLRADTTVDRLEHLLLHGTALAQPGERLVSRGWRAYRRVCSLARGTEGVADEHVSRT